MGLPSAHDFASIAREMHPLSSKLAEDTTLPHFQPVYDAENKKFKAPIHDTQDLTPPIRKHTFAHDIDPSTLISDEAVFRAFTGINWATSVFQPMGEEEDDEPVLDDPQPSTRQGQDQ